MTWVTLIHYCNSTAFPSGSGKVFPFKSDHSIVLFLFVPNKPFRMMVAPGFEEIKLPPWAVPLHITFCTPVQRQCKYKSGSLRHISLRRTWRAPFCTITIVNCVASTIENDMNYIYSRSQNFTMVMNDRESYRDQMLSLQLHQFYQEYHRRSTYVLIISLKNLELCIYSYLGNRLGGSESLYSSLTTRHSVFTSSEKVNWLRNACPAACMAAAPSILSEFNDCKTWLGRSIQNPVVSRSQGCIIKSTASKMVLPLSR